MLRLQLQQSNALQASAVAAAEEALQHAAELEQASINASAKASKSVPLRAVALTVAAMTELQKPVERAPEVERALLVRRRGSCFSPFGDFHSVIQRLSPRTAGLFSGRQPERSRPRSRAREAAARNA